MSTDTPHLSDDEVLAAIFLLGDRASNVELYRALTRRFDVEIERDYVDERVRRLQRARLVTVAPSLRAPGVRWVRLTAHGVERLCALQLEPIAPKTR